MTANLNNVGTTRVEENLFGIETVGELKFAGASGLMEVDENSGTSGDIKIKFRDILDISAWEVEDDIVESASCSGEHQLGICRVYLGTSCLRFGQHTVTELHFFVTSISSVEVESTRLTTGDV